MPKNAFITSRETFKEIGIRNVSKRNEEKYIKTTKITKHVPSVVVDYT